ncbi:MAG: hypothetical protein HKN48_04760 [Flavobacteriaceae bacterium]|nr:hypothetical protein [Flavobacteriaceae bacterium]
MNLKKSFFVALTLGLILVIAWEFYWRSQGVEPNLDDNKELWAQQRAKLEKPNGDEVVFIGSSRILFDIQLDIWREQTGTEPVMLAYQGSSPLPIFKDIVENTEYRGPLIVGITPGLFFSTTFPQASPIKRAQSRLDHYYSRTYAQRINQHLSVPLQNNLAFIMATDESWDDDVDLKTLLRHIKLGERAGPREAPFNNFEKTSLDRNVEMSAKTTTDTAFANTVKKVWQSIFSRDMPPPDKNSTTEFFLKYANQYQKEGGSIILVRCPSDGFFKEMEANGLPRARFWDSLVNTSKIPGYHYDDYPQFQNLNLPEWSHLSKEDADFFTAELIKIMKEDGVLTQAKTN